MFRVVAIARCLECYRRLLREEMDGEGLDSLLARGIRHSILYMTSMFVKTECYVISIVVIIVYGSCFTKKKNRN